MVIIQLSLAHCELKTIISTVLAVFFLLTFLPEAKADLYQQERMEILREQRSVQREMAKARRSAPSRLSELKLELLELQKALKEMKEQKAAVRREQALMKRKKLNPVSLSAVPETPKAILNVSESGKASYYADMFNGRKTASGEIFSNGDMTAAHKTLPFGTRVKVRNISNGNTIEVIITDRGPFTPGRIIDLTSHGFSQLDNLSRGVIDVEIEVLE